LPLDEKGFPDLKDLHITICFSREGRPAKSVPSLVSPSPFCNLIRQSPRGIKRCLESDRKAIRIASQRRRPYIYECHAGLIDGVIPVFLNDKPILFIMFGQFLCEKPSEEKFKMIWERVNDLQINEDDLRLAFFSLPIFPPNFVQSLAEGVLDIMKEVIKEIGEPRSGRKADEFSRFDGADNLKAEFEMWKAQQEWQTLFSFKEERKLLSLLRWGSNEAIRRAWKELVENPLSLFDFAPEEAKIRLWGIITSLLSYIRIFPAAEKIDLLKLSLQYALIIEKCQEKEELREAMNWIVEDILTLREEKRWQESLVERVKSYIIEHYNEEDLNLERIAREFKLSPYYLSHTFKRVEGEKLWKYLREVRLARAKELLETTDMSITDIALEVGYSDTAYFCTLFKKEVGVSPTRYRKNIVKGKRA